MPISIFEKNIALFKSRFPNVPLAEGKVSAYKVFAAKNGSITAKDNGALLHSQYNPEREAEKLVKASLAIPQDGNLATQAQSAIFLGFGLGYGPIAWAKLLRSVRYKGGGEGALILIESDSARFFAALHALDWSPVFSVPHLVIALECPKEKLIPLIESTAKIKDCAVFAVPSQTAHDAPYFDAAAALIERNKQKEEINEATTKRFAKRWIKNICLNADAVASGRLKRIVPLAIMPLPLEARIRKESIASCNISQQSKKGCKTAITGKKSLDANIPPPAEILPAVCRPLVACPPPAAVILAAGPSLEAVLPHLAKIREHSVIIAVETALRAALRAGVEPDYIVLTDPQYYAFRHIAGLSSPSSILVTDLCAYPAALRFDCRAVLLSQSAIPLARYFERKMNLSLASLGAGGSVASCAWNLAYLLGAKSIYVAGLDLSFPRGETHVKGSTIEEATHAACCRLCTAETAAVPRLISGASRTGKDYNGCDVATDSRMLMFAWWFESRIAQAAAEDSTVKTRTLCPAGLCIPGIETADIDTILHGDVIKRNADGTLQMTGSAIPPSVCDAAVNAKAGFNGNLPLIKMADAKSIIDEAMNMMQGISSGRLDAAKLLQGAGASS